MFLAFFKTGCVRLALVTVIILSIAVCSYAGQWKGREDKKDGKIHVINPNTPVESAVTYKTGENWRRGGEDDDVVFGLIYDVVRDGEGRSYLLDSQLSQVHVIAPDGEYLRSIGREGEGPGEFRRPSGIMLFSDGTVCVMQYMPGRAVLLTPDGEAAGEHTLPRGPDGSHAFLSGGSMANDQLILYLQQFIRAETSFGLQTLFVRIDPAGEILATYWELLQEQDLSKITFDEKTDGSPVWAASPDGRFFINNNWDTYAIEVVAGDGSPQHVIEREYEHRIRTPRDLELVDGRKEAGEIADATKVSETSRDLVRFQPRGDGTLWVLSSRGEQDVPDGVIATFDVFDKKGRFVRQATVQGSFRVGIDVFYVVDDYVFVVTNAGEAADLNPADAEEAADPMEVICLRLAEGN